MVSTRPRTVAIVQARMSSSRLPGKVLAPILGQPMLLRQLERIGRSAQIDEIVVATSVEPGDDRVAEICRQTGIRCVRGSLHDVLARYVQAADESDAEIILRLTADCPFTDPAVIDGLVQLMTDGDLDYASNTLERTWPHGLDVEAVKISALRTAAGETDDAFDREHVTPFFHKNPDRFRLGSLTGGGHRADYRLTVDFPEDLEVTTQIYEALYPGNATFTTDDVIDFLDTNPDIRALNSAHIIHRN